MKEPWQLSSTRTVDLDHEQLLILEGRPRTRIKVIHGGVWLTTEGDPSDRFPASGEEVAVRAKGRSIVESLGASRLEITTARGAIGWRLIALVSALRRRLRLALTRDAG